MTRAVREATEARIALEEKKVSADAADYDVEMLFRRYAKKQQATSVASEACAEAEKRLQTPRLPPAALREAREAVAVAWQRHDAATQECDEALAALEAARERAAAARTEAAEAETRANDKEAQVKRKGHYYKVLTETLEVAIPAARVQAEYKIACVRMREATAVLNAARADGRDAAEAEQALKLAQARCESAAAVANEMVPKARARVEQLNAPVLKSCVLNFADVPSPTSQRLIFAEVERVLVKQKPVTKGCHRAAESKRGDGDGDDDSPPPPRGDPRGARHVRLNASAATSSTATKTKATRTKATTTTKTKATTTTTTAAQSTAPITQPAAAEEQTPLTTEAEATRLALEHVHGEVRTIAGEAYVLDRQLYRSPTSTVWTATCASNPVRNSLHAQIRGSPPHYAD